MFVNLDRSFIPISNDEETSEWGDFLALRYGQSLQWAGLLDRQRVVLLAEAGSGKTAEFKNQSSVLRADGKYAFFVRVEDLADSDLTLALEPGEEVQFNAWRDGSAHAWFFLDSVDEARLVHRSFEKALRRFKRDMGIGLDRASVLISCRVSDWKGRADKTLVEGLLPVLIPHDTREPEGDPLLGPVLENGSNDESAVADDERSDRRESEVVTVVRLAVLERQHWIQLAQAAGISGAIEFSDAVEQNGLEVVAQRPKDLLDLAAYWRAHGTFGSLIEMTRFGIAKKLSESDSGRPDSNLLAEQQARAGAERIAAALTFGKSTTLRVPTQEPDPTLAAGALDPEDVLPEWTPAQRATLLRRAIFTPATYGRLRFHHRSTQEYLTAEWIARMRSANCPEREVHSLLFAERYGIETVIPSVRPVAAWLALRQSDIRREMIHRGPFELIRHGDPRSLPSETKAKVLESVIAKHSAGQLSDRSIDQRAVWMFADPSLATTIRRAWNATPDDEIRSLLIEIVAQGRIVACVNLARAVALDPAADPHNKYLALQAMLECNDNEGLADAARLVSGATSEDAVRYVVNFARLLYPKWLSRDILIRLIDETPETEQDTTSGFGRYVPQIFQATPESERAALLEELADLCLQQPFVADWARVSARHSRLIGCLLPLAIEIMKVSLGGATPLGLLKACAAIERTHEHLDAAKRAELTDLVRDSQHVNQELFWYDVLETCRNREKDVHFYWQLGFSGQPLWSVSKLDLAWLLNRVATEDDPQRRRIALSAYVERAGIEKVRLESDLLRGMVKDSEELERDLNGYLDPPKENPSIAEHRRRMRVQDERRARQRANTQRWWREFAERLKTDASHLRDRAKIVEWEFAKDLVFLTNWLQSKTRKDRAEACRYWQLLAEGFGADVAEAYRDGMCFIWRLREPGEPFRQVVGTPATFKWLDLLCFCGVGLEATLIESWASRLGADEAERALRHALCVDERSPDWLEQLVLAHPARLKPIIAIEAQSEWSTGEQGYPQVLRRLVDGSDAYFLLMADVVTSLLSEQPGRVNTYDIGIRAIERLGGERSRLSHLAEHANRKFREATARGDEEWAIRQLALWSFFDPLAAVAALEDSIVNGPPSATFAEAAFGVLFGDDHPLLGGVFREWPIRILRPLAALSFSSVRPEDDVEHVGTYSPGRRDNAEAARGALLKALLNIPGRETYEAIRGLAAMQKAPRRRTRYLALAHDRAEQDSEMPPWQPSEVILFERDFATPVRSGDSLLRVCVGVLLDIQRSLLHEDASSRSLLELADDEEKVQNWLAEQLRLRLAGRCHVIREAEVADDNKPDILLLSMESNVGVAIEVKHGDRAKWTVTTLKDRIKEQLVDKYLRTAHRRHGVFVVTHHRADRTWQHPDSGAKLTFGELTDLLSQYSATLTKNATGTVEVRVVGLDATPKRI